MSGLQVNMTKGSILKSLLIFSLPILMSNLFQQLYNTIDILIVGNYLGDSSLAAIGASSSIYELLIGFCFGVGSGLSIVVSRYYGYGDNELIKKAVAGAIVIAGCLTAVMMLFSLMGLYPMAAPRMPMSNCEINNRSKSTFPMEEKIKNSNGIRLLPIARSNPAHRL